MKTTIYLLPGLMCNQKLWGKITPLFDDSYELIFLDIPLKKTFEEMIEELAFLLPAHPVLLLGFSLGGYIASYFAVNYPQRVEKLFVLSSSCKPIAQEEIKKREQAIALVDRYGFKGLSYQKVQSLLEYENQNNQELIALIQEMYTDMGKNAFKMQMQASLVRKDLMQELSELKLPIFLCCSQNDTLADANWLKDLQQKNPKIKLNLFESISHMLPLEKPKETALVIKKWAGFS
jgi:pimeloyl-ACP methyl ester carboxylesterase